MTHGRGAASLRPCNFYLAVEFWRPQVGLYDKPGAKALPETIIWNRSCNIIWAIRTQEKLMAYTDREDPFPLWLTHHEVNDLLEQARLAFLAEAGEASRDSANRNQELGFIVKDWFGPFLLAPPSRSLRGRC